MSSSECELLLNYLYILVQNKYFIDPILYFVNVYTQAFVNTASYFISELFNISSELSCSLIKHFTDPISSFVNVYTLSCVNTTSYLKENY